MKAEVISSQELVCRPKGNRPMWVAWPGEAALNTEAIKLETMKIWVIQKTVRRINLIARETQPAVKLLPIKSKHFFFFF